MLSLVMIAFQEEETLDICLERIVKYVDEIVVVVDSRTTDRTAEIVRSYGGKALIHEWKDSFSVERNFGIGASKGDWILVLDCDEECSRELIKALPELTSQNVYDGFWLPRVNIEPASFEHNPPIMIRYEDWQLRLFRNYGRFQFRVHEKVTGLRNVVKKPNLHIIHWKPYAQKKHERLYPLYDRLMEMEKRARKPRKRDVKSIARALKSLFF